MEDYVSETADALASFLEAAHTGSVGDMHKTPYCHPHSERDDNKDYPTALRRKAAGLNYDSGKPKPRKMVDTHAKHRYEKDANPIGEGISETASALASFMEATHTGSAGNMKPTPYWGETLTRDDNREDYLKTGLDPAKGKRSKGDWDPANKGEALARWDKGADPLGGATSKQFVRP